MVRQGGEGRQSKIIRWVGGKGYSVLQKQSPRYREITTKAGNSREHAARELVEAKGAGNKGKEQRAKSKRETI